MIAARDHALYEATPQGGLGASAGSHPGRQRPVQLYCLSIQFLSGGLQRRGLRNCPPLRAMLNDALMQKFRNLDSSNLQSARLDACNRLCVG